MNRRAVLALLSCLVPSLATAGGHLWLGAEYAGEGNVYRYDIASSTIDLIASPPRPSGGEHWNNCATDATTLYLGVPNQQYIGYADPQTGMIHTDGAYSSTLAGRFEDGAVHPTTGNLWRVTYNGTLHETTTDGTLVQTYTTAGSLVGIEWVGSTLYAGVWTNSNTNFGRLEIAGTIATFVAVPWAAGGSPDARLAALAYDAQDDVLYVIAGDRKLHTVAVGATDAVATLVVDLSTLGYPGGALVDGMGWVAAPATGAPSTTDDRLGCSLSPPRPNPSREGGVAFSVTLREPQGVSLRILDVGGQVVRIWSGALHAGANELSWDFRDEAGRPVAAGVYFLRLEGAHVTLQRKIVRLG
jgi:hypothetical protein